MQNFILKNIKKILKVMKFKKKKNQQKINSINRICANHSIMRLSPFLEVIKNNKLLQCL